jgi:hypothetical protein
MSDETPEKKRRGKATKEKRGKAAQFAPGAAEGPKEFDAAAVAKELHLYWENGGGETFIVGSDVREEPVRPGALSLNGDDDDGDVALVEEKPQTWSWWPKRAVVNLLRSRYVSVKAREGEQLSNAEQVLMHTMSKRRLDGSFDAIPGYPAGMYTIQGRRYLVTTSPGKIDFKEGEWPTVRALIEGKLDLLDDEGHGIVQSHYFHAWMKKAIESLYLGGPGNFQNGPALIFAGRVNAGKSRIQHQIITKMLGGRSADPSAYLFGKTDFNSEIFSAEHVMMEELEQTSSRNADRVLFGERVKKLVTADRQRLHAKREDARMVEPYLRMTLSINDDPDKMRLLFLLTPDIRDKVMLFKVSDLPLPMPTRTLDERKAFRDQVTSELPAYGWWLMNEFEIPPAIGEGKEAERFGVKCWHHPTLALELFDDTPHAEFLQIVDAAEFSAGDGTGAERYKLWDLVSKAAKESEGMWEGTALELEALLLGEGQWKSSVVREMKKLVAHNRVDKLLGRLAEDRHERVVKHRNKMERRWIVHKPE